MIPKSKFLQKFLSVLLLFIFSHSIFAQANRWQQQVDYRIAIDFDVKKHQFRGTEKLLYTNNSPDALSKIYYHLYYNAFQPGSAMDIRSINLPDPDGRVKDRISKLDTTEIGYQRILSLKQNGKPLAYKTEGTILEVSLAVPILPGSKTLLEMEFEAQVPIQIRRTGRNNKEGIAYSMSQWYPKLCEYDYQGWHANPYVAREFYGVWGNFDVKINIDKTYCVAAGGNIQNANAVGYGYEKPGAKLVLPLGEKLLWHFKALNVHDFLWAADPEYKHTKLVNEDGIEMNFFYQENDKTKETWAALPQKMNEVFKIANKKFGKYPYNYYAFIQGGDGGMEYPMATLILGEGSMTGLLGVATHELMHSWYQMVLGTNESLYAWMDEGFTSYATNVILAEIGESGASDNNPRTHEGSYRGYFSLAASGKEEPLTTHADHFETNASYSRAAYAKGAVFLNQMEYIIGKPVFEKSLLDYFNTWKFKHPNSNDLIRIFEKNSGLELDWYKEYFVNSVKQIDYGIDSIFTANDKTILLIGKKKPCIMPLDIEVKLKDESKLLLNIPLDLMRGNKNAENAVSKFATMPDWTWTYPQYRLELPLNLSEIKSIEIDPSKRMADTNRSNNLLIQY